MPKDRENVYTCPVCSGHTVTIDRDEGVTPFMIGCRASGKVGDCNGKAESSFYPPGPRPDHIPAPSWEWYKPDQTKFDTLSRWELEHVAKGGLLIRKIGEAEDAYSKLLREQLGIVIRERSK